MSPRSLTIHGVSPTYTWGTNSHLTGRCVLDRVSYQTCWNHGGKDDHEGSRPKASRHAESKAMRAPVVQEAQAAILAGYKPRTRRI